jgi:hypothetical protein
MDQAHRSVTAKGVLVLGVIVTLNVCIAILEHWKHFDWSKRGLAVALLASLVGMPARMMWKREAGKSIDWQSLVIAYLWVLMVILLFGMR